MEEQIKILFVDDEKNVLKAIERIFLDDDYEILTVSSGEEGLEVMENTSPIQIVIADYRMPGMNGVDFLKEVCQRWPDTVRMILSGYADTASVVSAINEGRIYKFIAKPWDDNELRVTISNAIERYTLHKKNVQLTEKLKKKNEELQRLNDSLKAFASKLTSEFMFQSRVLTGSQNILDVLPVAVLGIDTNGLIVQCNLKGNELFGEDKGDIIGTNREDSLPEKINEFIEEVFKKNAFSGHTTIGSTDVKIRGVFMKHLDGQEGVILVSDWEGQ